MDSGQAARHRDFDVHSGRIVDPARSDIARHASLVWLAGARAWLGYPVRALPTEQAISVED